MRPSTWDRAPVPPKSQIVVGPCGGVVTHSNRPDDGWRQRLEIKVEGVRGDTPM